jgi:hypothetical protein
MVLTLLPQEGSYKYHGLKTKFGSIGDDNSHANAISTDGDVKSVEVSF